MSRCSSSQDVRVYNFQTLTGNYYANRILVHNCDLHARHIWLVNRKDSLAERLQSDPEWYDAKVAGWWLWGICIWIGGGWCSGDGAWQLNDTGILVKTNEKGGVRRKMPHVASSGTGINRQLPHLGDKGRGVNRELPPDNQHPTGINRQLPHLMNTGRGINRVRPHLGNDGTGINRLTDIATQGDYIRSQLTLLRQRLRRVRVCCGDWERVCGPSVTFKHGLCGVFLDPPYADTANRDPNLYAVDSLDVAHRVRKWAIANGDNPLMRIALAGYEGEHEMPESWSCWAWKAQGGYGSQRKDKTNENAGRERIWFSPHCVQLDLPLFAGLDEEDYHEQQ